MQKNAYLESILDAKIGFGTAEIPRRPKNADLVVATWTVST